MEIVRIGENDWTIEMALSEDGKKGKGGEKTWKPFTFDRVFHPSRGGAQQNVYEECKVFADLSTMQGINTCIFAYGQSGTGKVSSLFLSESGCEPRLLCFACAHAHRLTRCLATVSTWTCSRRSARTKWTPRTSGSSRA